MPCALLAKLGSRTRLRRQVLAGEGRLVIVSRDRAALAEASEMLIALLQA